MRKLVCGAAIMLCMFGAARAAEESQPRQRGNFDPEQFRQRMMDRIKETLAPSEDEWKVLQPKIEGVQKAQAQSRTGGGGFGRRGGGGGGNQGGATPAPEGTAAQPKSEVETKSAALRTLLENKEADPKVIAEKVKEFRDAREKGKVDLKKAQDSLREIVTPRQEAQLVLMGLLE